MYFINGRIQRILSDIEELLYPERMKLEGIEIRYGEIGKDTPVTAITDNWKTYKAGSPWSVHGGRQYALFRLKVVIPDYFHGKKTVLRVETNKDGWNALNPQMLVYVDGAEYQGLDTNHREVLISHKASKGKSYEIVIYAFSGLKRNYKKSPDTDEVKFYSELRTLDGRIEQYYYNLKAPLELAAQLPEKSVERIKLFNFLNESVNMLDLRAPYSHGFYESIGAANSILNEKLYGKEYEKDALVSCVGHTHIDIAWLWTYSHTRDKVVRSFSTVLKLMEEYPEYMFMSSQPQLYEYIKKNHPDVFKRIKQKVREGLWEAEGGMWVEADVNVTSGESLVRQFLIGRRFFKREFGVTSRILWLPDVFGYSAALPQIMKKSGIDYFMTAKLANNEINEFPYHTFTWRGIDGSEVLSHLVLYCPHGYNGQPDKGDVLESWENYKQKEINTDVMLLYGYGDGGGGPSKEMLETLRRYELGIAGAPGVRKVKAYDFFKELEKRVKNDRRLPAWVGELYYELHRGTYTSMARNKKLNRKAEFLYTTAEWMASLNWCLFGSEYPRDSLNEGWKGILLNQFHDVLPGTSIKEVYEDTDKIYDEIFSTGESILKQGKKAIAGSVGTGGDALIVFNPLSWYRDGIVEFEYTGREKYICLQGNDGYIRPCQKTGEGKFAAYVTGIAPKGYTVFSVKRASGEEPCSNLAVKYNKLFNCFYEIDLNEKGKFVRVTDKSTQRNILKDGERGNVLQAFEDKPRTEDNWNLDMFYSEKMWEVGDVESIKVVCEGPVYGALRIKRRFLDSMLTQDIIIYNDVPRIDFKTVIDWKEKDIVLKTMFPLDINSDRATYEIQYGHLERSTHRNTSWDIAKFEVCGHKWADVSENNYGVSLLNDCKYGYDIKDSNLRLTLLRCGTRPNPDADKEIHRFTYSLYPHGGRWHDACTVQMAYDLNLPLDGMFIEGEQEGELPGTFSMLQIDAENVVVEVVKMAEDSDELIVRMYEAYNTRGPVKVKVFRNIEKIEECNLMEEDITDEHNTLYKKGDTFSFYIKPFEIKSFKVKLEQAGR